MNFITNEYIDGVSGGDLTTPPWAISAWIKTTNNGVRIFGKNSASDGWEVNCVSNVLRFLVKAPGTLSDSTSVINNGVLNHIGIYYDGTTCYHYLNGAADGSKVVSFAGADLTSVNLRIGQVPNSATNFTGDVCDVRIYDNLTMTDHAAMFKILYEMQGRDCLEDTPVTRAALEFGAPGTTVGTTPNLGTAGGTFTVSGTPTYEKYPLIGN